MPLRITCASSAAVPSESQVASRPSGSRIGDAELVDPHAGQVGVGAPLTQGVDDAAGLVLLHRQETTRASQGDLSLPTRHRQRKEHPWAPSQCTSSSRWTASSRPRVDLRVRVRPQDGRDARRHHRRRRRGSCWGGRRTRCSRPPGRRAPSRTTRARRSSTTPRSTSSARHADCRVGTVAPGSGAYDADAIRTLKDETDGVLYVSGSGTLVRALLADGLVDELHLFVYPLALGSGRRLWADGRRHDEARAGRPRRLRQRRGPPGLRSRLTCAPPLARPIARAMAPVRRWHERPARLMREGYGRFPESAPRSGGGQDAVAGATRS